MPGATLSIGLRYPLTTDNNAAATDIQNLATDVDNALNISFTQTQINGFTTAQKWDRRRIYNSSFGGFQYWDEFNGVWTFEETWQIAQNNDLVGFQPGILNSFNYIVKMNNTSLQSFLIPTNATIAFPIGSVVRGFQYGAGGQTLIEAQNPATTAIRSAVGFRTRARYSRFEVIKIGIEEWLASGDLVP